MANSASTTPPAETHSRSFRIRMVAAFFCIYFLWGTTFLGIRIAVEELPPFFAAGMRFFTAGVVLYGFMRLRGAVPPNRLQWRNLGIMALLIFVAEYGPLFWAEKYVPSGIVSVLAATIPIVTNVIEMLILRQQSFRWGIFTSSLLGFAGVAVLLSHGAGQSIGLRPSLAVLCGVVSWSFGTVLSRGYSQPASRPLTSGAIMMLGGAGLLILSAAFGEMHPFPHISLRAVLALLYLIVFGSLIAFTAFVWLLSHMPASSVSSYAYVNPIVAVALGHYLAAEPVTPRTFAGSALVILSVFLILRPKKKTA